MALVGGAVLLVWLLFAIALGASGATPGKAAAGLRAVNAGTGTPIGVGRALLRGLVLGLATIPTFGIGLATLAWTAVMDPGAPPARLARPGWPVRSWSTSGPSPPTPPRPSSGPRHVVNLTAMRLVPAAPAPQPPAAPRRPPRPAASPPPTGEPVAARSAPAPVASASPTARTGGRRS